MIGKPIGQTGFISSPITRVENAPEFQRCRPHAERPDFRGGPPSEEQVAKLAAFNGHEVARAAAARIGVRRVFTPEEVNARAIAAVAQAPGAAFDTTAILAALATIQATLDDRQAVQAEINRRILLRLDAIDGNPDGNAFAGEVS
jgi:hypothetical protein